MADRGQELHESGKLLDLQNHQKEWQDEVSVMSTGVDCTATIQSSLAVIMSTCNRLNCECVLSFPVFAENQRAGNCLSDAEKVDHANGLQWSSRSHGYAEGLSPELFASVFG